MSTSPRSTTSTHDEEVRDAVESELQWVPEIDAARIGVAVDNGVVTLTGQVSSYSQKMAAARAAFRIRSVTAVANDLTVHYPGDRPTDTDLAAAARTALDTAASVPGPHIMVEVRNGSAILTGETMWNFQRQAAVKAVGRLQGISGVDNRITLTRRPDADAAETARVIRDAITRHAALDAAKVHVHASGDSVELTGTVSSWAAKHQAELAAWSSPHVNHVHNKIVIRN